MRRRVLLGAAVALTGCGFELKRPAELSFRPIQLTAFPPPPQPVLQPTPTLHYGPPTPRVPDLYAPPAVPSAPGHLTPGLASRRPIDES